MRHHLPCIALLLLVFAGGGCEGFDLSNFEISEKIYVHYPVGDYSLKGDLVARYDSLRSLSAEREDFIFFTDPHLLMVSDYEIFERCDTFVRSVKNYFSVLDGVHVICGGDWLGNSDSPSAAISKLDYCNSQTYRYFGDSYHALVGNHDTNYQGCSEDGTPLAGELSADQYGGAYLSHIGSTYYAFSGRATRFYMLDTYTDWNENLTPYRVEQAKWLAGSLKQDDAPNSAVGMHIYFSSEDGTPANSASAAIRVVTAYNTRSTVEIDGDVYDFSSCSGRVRFILCGHVHKDLDSKLSDGTPVFSTVNMRNGNVPDFDLVSADYEHGVIKLVRVGRGEDRVIQMVR